MQEEKNFIRTEERIRRITSNERVQLLLHPIYVIAELRMEALDIKAKHPMNP
jgi:hypothetical protein